MSITKEQQEQALEIVGRAMEHAQDLLYFTSSVSHEAWQKELRDILAHVYGDLHTRYSAKDSEYRKIASRYAQHKEFATAASTYHDLANSCRVMANSYYTKAEYGGEIDSLPETQNLAEFRENQIVHNKDQMRELMQEVLDVLRDDPVAVTELSEEQREAEIPLLLLSIKDTVSRIGYSSHYQSLAIAYIEWLLEATSPDCSSALA